MPDFVAIDGEAIHTGQYVLMRDSTGRQLANPNGLKTAEIFRWLLELDPGKGRRTREHVVFGLNYDVNQWLISLRPGQIKDLLDTGTVIWNGYEITWMPAKTFEIRHLDSGAWLKVCEVFGFFQTSFVKALKSWGFQVPARMEEMKGARNDFTAADMDEMSAYCVEECEFLARLMDRLADACRRAGCEPARNWWVGAGSVANALMRNHGVRDHVTHDRELADRNIIEEYVLRAYFGGRVELLAIGRVGDVQTRDVRSAYPWAATHLPSLAGAELQWLDRYDPTAEHAIWRCAWAGQVHGQLAPFPTRTDGHAIVYPEDGSGCYHAIEVRTAVELGYDIRVIDGVVLSAPCSTAPFAFIPQVYAQRAKLKQRGDAAEKALKLGMNSVYGKLAQGYGRVDSDGHVLAPPYQSYMWAGEITARTRARVLQAAHGAQGVAMISTDGVFARRFTVKGTARPDLGTWEAGGMRDLFCAMAGVYHGYSDDGGEVRKSRGFFARDVDYHALRDVWDENNVTGQLDYSSHRFIGARVAMARNTTRRADGVQVVDGAGFKAVWRQWVDEQRSISLHPDGWRRRWEEEGGDTVPGARVVDGQVKLYPPRRHVDSMPYEPKTALYDAGDDMDVLEMMAGDDQPDFDVD